MYHQVVARQVRRIFADLNRGDPATMLAGLAPDFVYRFHGESPLSGVRRTLPSMRIWWDRIFEILPDAQFAPERVLVTGWPANTTVATLVRISGTLADGSAYSNSFGQFIRLRWGKLVEIETIEDTQRLAGALDIQAAHGIAAASAPPIED